MDFLPVPSHPRQEVVLWPWHFGHNTLWGIVLLQPFQQTFPESSGLLWTRFGQYVGGAVSPSAAEIRILLESAAEESAAERFRVGG
jgi:hypothetical protein